MVKNRPTGDEPPLEQVLYFMMTIGLPAVLNGVLINFKYSWWDRVPKAATTPPLPAVARVWIIMYVVLAYSGAVLNDKGGVATERTRTALMWWAMHVCAHSSLVPSVFGLQSFQGGVITALAVIVTGLFGAQAAFGIDSFVVGTLVIHSVLHVGLIFELSRLGHLLRTKGLISAQSQVDVVDQAARALTESKKMAKKE